MTNENEVKEPDWNKWKSYFESKGYCFDFDDLWMEDYLQETKFRDLIEEFLEPLQNSLEETERELKTSYNVGVRMGYLRRL